MADRYRKTKEKLQLKSVQSKKLAQHCTNLQKQLKCQYLSVDQLKQMVANKDKLIDEMNK